MIVRPDNRSALLLGARQCLDRQGYARTRARDVAEAAGVSLAAIGYHFGTIDALLVEALMDGMQEWSAAVEESVGSADAVAERWAAVLASFDGYRGVLAASFELIARAEQVPEVAERLRTAVGHARLGLARQVYDVDPTLDPERAEAVGAACYAVLSGLLVQWLVDPALLPTPEGLATGLAALA